MKNTMKKNILNRVILLASLITATGLYANTENEATMTSFGSFVYAIEKNMSDFFSTSVKTHYNTCALAFEKTFQDIKRKIEPTTRGVGNALTAEIDEIIDYALQQFNIVYGIIKKYNGKTSSEAQNFAAEIQRDFNAEKVFSEIISKLKVLKCKAIQANESGLVKKIETVTQMIEKKRKEWNAKPKWALLAGLSARMDAR